MFIMLMANNSPLRNQTPPCNGNPTLILKFFQPHRDLGYWKIQQAPPPGTRGGAHYVTMFIYLSYRDFQRGVKSGINDHHPCVTTCIRVINKPIRPTTMVQNRDFCQSHHIEWHLFVWLNCPSENNWLFHLPGFKRQDWLNSLYSPSGTLTLLFIFSPFSL